MYFWRDERLEIRPSSFPQSAGLLLRRCCRDRSHRANESRQRRSQPWRPTLGADGDAGNRPLVSDIFRACDVARLSSLGIESHIGFGRCSCAPESSAIPPSRPPGLGDICEDVTSVMDEVAPICGTIPSVPMGPARHGRHASVGDERVFRQDRWRTANLSRVDAPTPDRM